MLPARAVSVKLTAFRLLNALLATTYVCPDEYWQGPEVAHRLVFGYGYLTWEWREGIRSILHPTLLAAPYALVRSLGLDHTMLLHLLPKCLQAALALLGDWGVYRLSNQLFGSKVARYALWCNLASWFTFYLGTRTLSNTAEWAFTSAALGTWPWAWHFHQSRVNDTSNGFYASCKIISIPLLLAALATLLRPTNAIIWALLFVHLLFISRPSQTKCLASFLTALVIGCFAILGMIGADWSFYGHPIFTPLAFIQANIMRGISIFYGSHPWHWYFTQGLTLILLTYLPLCIYGFIGSQGRSLPLVIVLIVVGVYSLLAHKEHRFLFPLLPFLMPYAGRGMWKWVSKGGKSARSISPRLPILLLLLPNLLVGIYFATLHQRGVVDVMTWLRQQDTPLVHSVGFLMPCHSTPYYSALHRPIPMWFLECEPPASAKDMDMYEDEADAFYRDPHAYILKTLGPIPSTPQLPSSIQLDRPETWMETKERWWPSHLILFEALLPTMAPILQDSGYTQCASLFNSHFHDDARRYGHVLVYCLS